MSHRFLRKKARREKDSHLFWQTQNAYNSLPVFSFFEENHLRLSFLLWFGGKLSLFLLESKKAHHITFT